jgi:hypothetical protein
MAQGFYRASAIVSCFDESLYNFNQLLNRRNSKFDEEQQNKNSKFDKEQLK